MTEKNDSLYEGKQGHIPDWKTPEIETFTNVYPGRDYLIEFTVPEFTALCPKTGLPDFGTISVSYVPRDKCLELKSFKEYILAFRNVGIFHENVVNKVLEDCKKAVNPSYIKVVGDYNARGGIRTKVTREEKA